MNDAPDLETIVSALKREYEDADDYWTGTLWPEVEAAIKYYEAQPFGDEVEGRSQLVLPDVAEVIDYMAQSVLRNFVSADRVVEIEATNEEDEEGADEATAALDYNFRREQDGYRVLSDWLQSGLLEKVAAIKTVCEEEEQISRERGIVDEATARILDSGDALDEGEELEGLEPQEDGSYLATLKRTKIVKRYRDVPIPLAEFRFSRNARHEDDADYLAHVCLKTRSDLVEMGFDRDQVEELPTSDNLEVSRRSWTDDTWRDTSAMPSELQTVLLCEEYARMDVDGDGIAERVRVFRVENEILTRDGEPAIETIEDNPIVVFSPFPRAHRLVGNSMADKSMDLQRIRSVTARQLMDGMYNANMPRPMVDMAATDSVAMTLEDILRPVPGSPIRYKGQAPQPYETAFDVGKSISVLEFWTGERETRTGITRMNQGLDADTLNKTATGAAMMQAQGQQHEEAVARVFGEAFGRLMAKKMRLMKREGAKFPIKLDNPTKDETGQVTRYRTVDASQWPDEFNTIVRVGLGTGKKEQVLQNIFALGNYMERAAQIGAVNVKGVVALGTKLVRTLQLGQGDDFFVDPETIDETADPEADAKKAEIEGKVAVEGAKLQISEQQARHKMSIEERRLAFEQQMAMIEMQADAALAQMKASMGHEAAMQKNRSGGRLDA